MTGLMAGKRGLIMGLANDRSIAWGIAKALSQHGAELAFSYQGESLQKRVAPLAASLGSDFLIDCDVSDMAALDRAFDRPERGWGRSTSSSTRSVFRQERASGKFVDTSLDNFLMTMNISAYSFVAVTRRARELMPEGGSDPDIELLRRREGDPPLQRDGSAKAALETSVKYLAWIWGPRSIRVNAISAGPDQDAGGERHRRLPLHPEMERI
jgi:enoyl-[acyl-carrier protein] reductase I